MRTELGGRRKFWDPPEDTEDKHGLLERDPKLEDQEGVEDEPRWELDPAEEEESGPTTRKKRGAGGP